MNLSLQKLFSISLLLFILVLVGCKKGKEYPEITISSGPDANAELQTAIDDLCQSGGGIIKLEAGEYDITERIRLNNCKEVAILGQSYLNTTFVYDSSSVDTGIVARNCQDIVFQNI